MRIIFAGTTDFGIPTLEQLNQNNELLLVITQPDRPTGRKQLLTPPPVKLWALKNNARVLQPQKISELKSEISNLNPDLMIVAAYGQIIPKEILDLPKYGSINIHGSILPKYRGATPIQAAIYNGDFQTGITLIKMDEKMDHGPILAVHKVSIDPDDTYTSLHGKLSQAAAQFTLDTISGYMNGEIKPQVQDETRADYTKLLTRADGKINWTRKAYEITNQIRAYNPEPGTWTTESGKTVKILEAVPLLENKIELPGKIYRKGSELAVKCSDYSIVVKKIQPEGKQTMTGSDFLNGLKNIDTKIFV